MINLLGIIPLHITSHPIHLTTRTLVSRLYGWRGHIRSIAHSSQISSRPQHVICTRPPLRLSKILITSIGNLRVLITPMRSMVTNGISDSTDSIITGWSRLWRVSWLGSRGFRFPLGPLISMTPVRSGTNSSFCC